MEKWIGDAVAKMHINRITQSVVADKMGVTREYISNILNGVKQPANAENRIMTAIDEIIKEKERN